ncbi:MAG: VOC family protein, partial [Bacteroidota bacterium]
MKKLNFSIQINATKARVWNTLWDDDTYRKWTVVFQEGSYAESDWEEGSPIKFLGPGGNGMSSRIARLIPNEFMSFEHLAEIKNGVENPDFAWAGSFENYSLHEKDGGTELVSEMDSDANFESFFLDTVPKALELIKQLAERQTITPFLWFDKEAEEATLFYTSLFSNSKVHSIMRNGDVVFTTGFTLAGQFFAALNGGPMYKINPSISLYTICESEAEIDVLWEKLIDGGSALMPLGAYPWNAKYGWLQDRYGLNWQLTLGKVAEMGQKITPALMFTGAQHGKAESAINFYSGIFKHPYTKLLSRYAAGGQDPEGTINHAQFSLDGQM